MPPNKYYSDVQILPSGDVFLVKLVEGIVDAILFGGSGLKVSQSKKFYEKLPIGKLLIPFALIAQVRATDFLLCCCFLIGSDL